MRFCPFCAQENPDDSRECVHCGKRLPAARTPPPRPPPPVREKPALKVPARPAPRSLPKPEPPKPEVVPTPLAPPLQQSARPPAPTPQPPPMQAIKPSTSQPEPLPPPPPVHHPTGTLLGIQAADSERRSTKPLPIGALEVGASRGEPSLPGLKDDLPTDQNPRVDSEDLASADEGATTPDMPDLFMQERGPRDDSLTLPKPRKAVVTRLESATRPSERKSPVAPLPVESPKAIEPFNDGPSISYQGSEPAPPVLDPSHTPILPTLALPPMPPGPTGSNIFGSVKYLLPLARAVVARKRAQRSIRQLLHDDQHLLDQVLRELGRAARENDLDVPAIADEMRRVKSEEQRRAKAEADQDKAADELGREDARWNGDEAERKAEIGRREAELKETEDELRQKGEERRGHEAERARLDGLIRGAEKRSAQALQQAQKAEITPPEKGGGPNTAANLRMQSQEAQKEATSLVAPRDEARAKAEALDPPIQTLTQKIVDQRALLMQKKKELADAGAQHRKTQATLEADKQRATGEAADAKREISQRFVNVGTMLNLHRVEDAKYKSLYERIDELKSGLNAREATIVRLESELRTYDRGALQTGLIAVGVVFAVLVIVAIVLVVLLSR